MEKIENPSVKKKNLVTLKDVPSTDLNLSNGIINYSNIVFTEQEQHILKKGPKYYPHIKHKTKRDTLVTIGNIINNQRFLSTIKNEIKNII